MSTIYCDIDSLSKNSKCMDCLSLTEKNALKLYFMAQGLKAIGGVDYSNINTLLSASACLKCESSFRLDSFETYIWQQAATASGANTGKLTIAQMRNAIRCFCGRDGKALWAAYVFLLCAFVKKELN